MTLEISKLVADRVETIAFFLPLRVNAGNLGNFTTIHIRLRKYLIASIFVAGAPVICSAQGETNEFLTRIERNDIGVFGGVAFYMGDFNENKLIYQPSPHAGLLYRYNFTRYIALRAQIDVGRIQGDSKYYGDLPGFPSGYVMKFQRNIGMGDVLMEFNFLPFSPTDTRSREYFAPYLILGVGVNFIASNKLDNNPELENAAIVYPELYGVWDNPFPQKTVIHIPMGFGVKAVVAPRFTLSLEWLFKKSFYDGIDGFTNRGPGSFNLFNDDWVSTISLGISYRIPIGTACQAYQAPVKAGRLLRGASWTEESGSRKEKSRGRR